MSKKYEKLKNLLNELFQLDQPDLDFGLYRIMHAKSAEITQFLDRDLLPQVQQEFAQYKTADKSDLEAQLAKVIAGLQAAEVDPETSPKVRELREKIASDSVDLAGLESEVYDHLYGFFRRYYSEGDFLSKRVYKSGVYAIPYEGEEVKLHWANADQYYIKTSEYLRDYAFRLHPDDEQKPMRVHFRLVDAAEGEHGNVKAAEGKDRIFILASKDFAAIEPGEQGPELAFQFEYRPATLTDLPDDVRDGKKKPPTQKEMTDLAESRIMTAGGELATWITELGKPHEKADGELADYSRLRAHLNRYVARNTFDYFIHKDLGGFLRRELDFYIKNEVMHLDDIEGQQAPRVEQYLAKVRVIRRIATKIITFLAHLEDFQKKIWLKKKFVVETSYCVTVDRVPEELYPEIAANDPQREEWVRLFAINEIERDLNQPGYTVPLTNEFLKAHPLLVVDSSYFSSDFTSRLLDSATEIFKSQPRCLIHSDNFQSLQLLERKFESAVRFIYIDPPYNTGSDEFLYKDFYQHSSWASCLSDRLALAHRLISDDGAIAISIGEEELGLLQQIMDSIFGRENRIAVVTVKRASVTGHKAINPGVVNVSEFVLIYAKSRRQWTGNTIYAERERDDRYSTFVKHRDASPDTWEFVSVLDALSEAVGIEKRQLRSHLGDEYEEKLTQFVYDNANAVCQPVTVDLGGVGAEFREWVGKSSAAGDQVLLYQRTGFPDAYLRNGKKLIFYSDKMMRVGERWATAEKASDIWTDVLPNDLHNEGGVELPKGKKPEALLSRLIELGTSEGDVVLDFFAGTATAAAAAQKMNRRWIAVESASYFIERPLRRMKNVLHGETRGVSNAFDWKGGGCFSVLSLESYEDALNNLQLRRSKAQQSLLDAAQNTEASRLKEQYMLGYMLNVEAEGSQSLLNVRAFTDPTSYKLKVKRPGSDETREVNVDLLETFNWLIGLTVQHIAAPQRFSAKFEHDGEGRLQLKGRLKQDNEGGYWFRTVTGTTPDGRKTLVIWRKRPGGETPEGVEQDNLILDEWFTKQGYSSKDSEFGLIYVNGTNNLENLRTPEDLWKVRLIEEDFHRLMFAAEGV
jgi:adenine-specific DNA-methyltransferase